MSLLMIPAVAPILRPLLYLPNSVSSFKLHRTAGKGTVEGPNLKCSSKYCLGATSISAAEAGIDDEKNTIPLRKELMPKHVAVIMDGNGRWAKLRGLPIENGHKAGFANLRKLILLFSNLGIKTLSLYAFSTENWNRSQMEVNSLMSIIEDFLRSYAIDIVKSHNVRFTIIGDKLSLPKSIQHATSLLEEASKDNKGMHIVIALSYSGQYDIVQATKKIASKVEDGVILAKEIDKAMFEQQILTNSIEFPNPDFLIRTSGEMRISNFMLWQLAYTELYFCDKLFPDFGKDELIEALISFQCRHRRYGDRED